MKKYKVLILGTTGMLGSQMSKLFLEDKRFKIFEMNRKKKLNSIKINIENKDNLINKIQSINPDYVINCIGWIKQKHINIFSTKAASPVASARPAPTSAPEENLCDKITT